MIPPDRRRREDQLVHIRRDHPDQGKRPVRRERQKRSISQRKILCSLFEPDPAVCHELFDIFQSFERARRTENLLKEVFVRALFAADEQILSEHFHPRFHAVKGSRHNQCGGIIIGGICKKF